MNQRVILIGYGNMGKHYASVINEIDGMEVVAVAGRNAQKAEALAKERGIGFHGADIRKLAAESRATMALVCTANAAHYEGVKEAAECGLHVLCEKPLHIDPVKQNEMIDICRLNGVKLGVCYRLRMMEHLRYVKDFLASGGLGKILVIDTYIKLWRDDDYYTGSSWHGTLDIDGGGPFIQQGSHFIDLAVWFGNGFKRVISSDLFTLLHPIKAEDHGYAVVEYGNGAAGLIQASTICKGAQSFNSKIEISGTKGSIYLDNLSIILWEVDDADNPQIAYKGDVFDKQLIDFVDAIENNREPIINGEDAKTSVELIDQIYKFNREL